MDHGPIISDETLRMLMTRLFAALCQWNRPCDGATFPSAIETYRIQELHLPIYHCLCLMLEERFFDA